MAILDDAFFGNLPQNNTEAAFKIIDRIHSFWLEPPDEASPTKICEEIIVSLEIFWAYCEQHGVSVEELVIEGDVEGILYSLRDYLPIIHHRTRTDYELQLVERAKRKGKERFAKLSGQLFCYKLSDDDITRIKTCLDELWALISTSEEIAEDHRKRLLTRLEQLQEELHKKLSDLDRFWGLFGDAFTVMKKLGDGAEKTAKICTAITTIAGIIYATQNGAHGLPSSDHHPNLGDLLPKLLQPKPAEHKTPARAPIEV